MNLNPRKLAPERAFPLDFIGIFLPSFHEENDMSDALDFDDDVFEPEEEEPTSYDANMNLQRHDVRRKIEEMMERRRLREEFGDIDLD